jgi:hypothetical protein
VADAQRHFIGGIDGGAPDAPPLVRDVAASGPWFWAGSGPLGFLRGGVLVTPWGEGVWGLERKPTTALGSDVERAPPDAVFADFAGSFHTVRMLTTAPRLFMRMLTTALHFHARVLTTAPRLPSPHRSACSTRAACACARCESPTATSSASTLRATRSGRVPAISSREPQSQAVSRNLKP